MAANKNALIRYKTIDKCLQNRYRKWTLENLIDACSDALYEYEGKDTYVSKRTVQLDIQTMRSDKLGYNAPIVVENKKYYTYADKNYSITNIPITQIDLEKLAESVTFLKQFKGFSHFEELESVIQKLEDHVYSKQTSTKPIIQFEKNENLKGLKYLDVLYQNIIRKKSIQLTYQSFKARAPSTFVFHAYLLKEFRNRWFVIGVKNKQEHLMNLALDRIHEVETIDVPYRENTLYDLDEYFSKAIGVSVNPDLETRKIVLFVYHKHAPYVLTKPFHSSQRLEKRDHFGITISLDIQHNFELEKDILGFGEGIRVISPPSLKRRIKERLIYAAESYQTEISEKGLFIASKTINHKGAVILNQVYSPREIKRMHRFLNAFLKVEKEEVITINQLLTHIPDLEKTIFNENLTKIVAYIYPQATLVNSVFHKKISMEIVAKQWFQIEKKGFSIQLHLKEIDDNSHLNVVLASHNKIFTAEEINIIAQNSAANNSPVRLGGIHILDNHVLRKWHSNFPTKNRNIIELCYSFEG